MADGVQGQVDGCVHRAGQLDEIRSPGSDRETLIPTSIGSSMVDSIRMPEMRAAEIAAAVTATQSLLESGAGSAGRTNVTLPGTRATRLTPSGSVTRSA